MRSGRAIRLLVRAWFIKGMAVAELETSTLTLSGAGANNPRLSRAGMGSLAHEYAYRDAPGEGGQG